MPCTYPLQAYRPAGNAGGPLVFDRRKSASGIPIAIPCGQCTGCRLERARQWAVRCSHEASLHDFNCFLTLTYDDEHLPAHQSLSKLDYTLFMKRLREYVRANFGVTIRFFGCGEYGELFQRPHYHFLIFGFDFQDKRPHSKTKAGFQLWSSAKLSELWPHGLALSGVVCFATAGYCARYCLKKVTGEHSAAYYGLRLPEFATMSRRPGIGKTWLQKFSSDVYPEDFVLSDGVKARPPRYYDNQLKAARPGEFEIVKDARRPHSLVAFQKRKYENSKARLDVKAEIIEARLKLRNRGLE